MMSQAQEFAERLKNGEVPDDLMQALGRGLRKRPDVVRFILSPDLQDMELSVREEGGIRSIKMHWDHPVLPEELERALDPPSIEKSLGRNDSMTSKRRRTPFGVLYIHRFHGKPTWWWPRLFFDKGALVTGWLQHGFAITLRRT